MLICNVKNCVSAGVPGISLLYVVLTEEAGEEDVEEEGEEQAGKGKKRLKRQKR